MTSPLAERLRAAFGTSLRTTAGGGRRTAENGGSPSPPALSQGERGLRSAVVDRPSSPLSGFEIQTEAGPCLVYEERFPLEHRHGGVAMGSFLEIPPRGLTCLAKRPDLSEVDLRRTVFLDTETTGLAGGTGTTAFLVGLAYFEISQRPVGAQFIAPAPAASGAMNCAPTDPLRNSQYLIPNTHFVVRQFFMRDFGEERAMLLAVAEALAPFRYLVTFNGKSFDLPLLETRYILARLPRRWQAEVHFDLLHPARRLWRERLGVCSLAALEEGILEHWREDDVPSWAIPSLYSAYLREGKAGAMRRVFEHNRHDLLSLAALGSHLGRRLADPLGRAHESGASAEELLAIARLYDELGLRAEACACLEVALERATDGSALRSRIQLLLALFCKRAGERERALGLWRELARGPGALTALIELAKHHEHHQRNPAAALEVVEQALAILELREARDGAWRWRAERADLEGRYTRLLRKSAIARNALSAAAPRSSQAPSLLPSRASSLSSRAKRGI